MIVSVDGSRAEEVAARCAAAEIPLSELGVAGGDRVVIEGAFDLAVSEIKAAATGVSAALEA